MRKILSGGHSLIPLMQFRLATPPFLVDINRIPGLDIGAVTPDESAASILAELMQVCRQHIAPQAAEFAQVVATESIVSSEVIDPICDMTVETATARYVRVSR